MVDNGQMNKALRAWLNPDRMRKIIEGLLLLNLILLVTAVAYGFKISSITNTNHRLALDGKEAHDSICALRGDFQRNVDLTEKFLSEHPEPKILGVDRQVFVQSLAGRKLTLKSLKGLSCTHEESKKQ
jgi:hypothetical protein